MDFREYEVVREGDEVVVVGTIRDPVNWDFSIRVCEDDFAGLLHVALRKPMLGILFRSLFRRRHRDHWTGERSEHLAEGARRLPVAQKKARERESAYRAEEETRRAKAAAGRGRVVCAGRGRFVRARWKRDGRKRSTFGYPLKRSRHPHWPAAEGDARPRRVASSRRG